MAGSVKVLLKTVFDDKGLKQAESSFDKLSGTLKNVAGGIVAALSVKAITDFTMKAVNAASNLSAEFEGVNQIFGASAKAVQDFAKQAAYSVGISETAALQAAKNFGTFATSAGLAGSEAAGFSTKLVQAAGDLASFNDVPVEETLAAIRSGLQGQGEPLSRFGILMNEATLKAKAMEMGIINNTKNALTPQQKVLAANKLILDELGVAQGDFVKYQDTYGNAVKTINATMQNLVSTIGTELLPIAETMAIDFRDFLTDMSDPTTQLGEDFAETTSAFTIFVETIADGFASLDKTAAGSAILDLLEGIFIGFSEIAWVAGDAADTMMKAFSGDWAGAWRNITTFFTRYNSFVDKVYNEIDARTAASQKKQFQANQAAAYGGSLDYLRAIGAVSSTVTAAGGGGGGGTGVADAMAKARAAVQKVVKDTQSKLAKANADYNASVLKAQETYKDNVVRLEQQAQDARLSIIQQSQDRLRSAFMTAIGFGGEFSLASQFEKEGEKSVQYIIDGFTKKLADSKRLVEQSSKLASEGFSQTFIEQIVAAGTQTGNEMAAAILEASPETKSEMRRLFGELETISQSGMDTLAQTIYDQQGLATQELKTLYAQVQKDLDAALLAEQHALNASLETAAQTLYDTTSAIRLAFIAEIDAMDGALGGLNKTVDQMLAKLATLQAKSAAALGTAMVQPGASLSVDTAVSGVAVSTAEVNKAAGIVIDSIDDVAGTYQYLADRITAAQKYISAGSTTAAQKASAQATLTSLQTQQAGLYEAAKAGTAVGTVININVKTDTTQSNAMVGKTLGNIVTKYVSTGGQVLVSAGS